MVAAPETLTPVLEAPGDACPNHSSPARPPADSARLAALLERLDLEEKVRLLTGADFWSTTPIPSIGLRRIVFSDGPSGVRGERWDERDPSLNLPSSSALSAAWDRGLAARYGAAIGGEAHRKGIDVVLGPTVNLHRTPLGGRNFECYSEDPLLTAETAAAYVQGLQATGVAAAIKHYVANDYETERFTADTRVSERALRELYLAAFETAVAEAHVWAVMSAYNGINGTTASESPLLETPLSTEWGFDGVVVSDWTGVRSLRAATAAQDLAMPGPHGAWGPALVDAVRAGEVAEADIDRKVLRILGLAARVGALEGFEPAVRDVPEPEDAVALIREVEAEGMVLVRNTGLLPLERSAIRRIAVVGHNAVVARTQGGGSATVLPERVVSPLDGVRAAFPGAEVDYAIGAVVESGVTPIPVEELASPVTGAAGVRARFLAADGSELFAEDRRSTALVWIGSSAPVEESDRLELTADWTPASTGTVGLGFAAVGRTTLEVDGEVLLEESVGADGPSLGAAFLAPPMRSQRLETVAGRTVRLRIVYERAVMSQFPGNLTFTFGTTTARSGDDLLEEAERIAAAADLVVLVVGTNAAVESEEFDRTDLRLPGRQDELAERVLASGRPVVAVVNAGAPVELPWRDRAAAVLLAWFGGQGFGDALGDVLTGAQEPGGRLPTTWPGRLEDAPVTDTRPIDGVLEYREGLNIGYRGWARQAAVPAFAFGSGAGYTTWALEDAAVVWTHDGPLDPDAGAAVAATVHVRLRNTGSRRGKQVVQLYAGRPQSAVERPLLWLAGYEAVRAEGGRTAEVEVPVTVRSLRHWDDGWRLESGVFRVNVGFAADDLPLAVEIVAAGPLRR